jgi:DNA phosphorothioation-dependent restriction protein DptG
MREAQNTVMVLEGCQKDSFLRRFIQVWVNHTSNEEYKFIVEVDIHKLLYSRLLELFLCILQHGQTGGNRKFNVGTSDKAFNICKGKGCIPRID